MSSLFMRVPVFSAHSSRTKSERIRNEADTLMANCASKTQRSQQEANNRSDKRNNKNCKYPWNCVSIYCLGGEKL